MPYDKSLPYSCPCCGYWNGDMKYDYYRHNKKEPLIKDDEIGKQLISSKYDSDFYWADEEQQEAYREFCREEDDRPENQSIPSDAYSDNGLCLAKEFGGVLSGNDRPRNMSEYNAWRSGNDFKMVREANERLGKERWLRFVQEYGLEKFVEHKEPLIKDEKIDYLEIKHLIKEAMREAEEERVKRLAQYYAELYGEEE